MKSGGIFQFFRRPSYFRFLFLLPCGGGCQKEESSLPLLTSHLQRPSHFFSSGGSQGTSGSSQVGLSCCNGPRLPLRQYAPFSSQGSCKLRQTRAATKSSSSHASRIQAQKEIHTSVSFYVSALHAPLAQSLTCSTGREATRGGVPNSSSDVAGKGKGGGDTDTPKNDTR